MTNNQLADLLEELADMDCGGYIDGVLSNCQHHGDGHLDNCPVPRALAAAKEFRVAAMFAPTPDMRGMFNEFLGVEETNKILGEPG